MEVQGSPWISLNVFYSKYCVYVHSLGGRSYLAFTGFWELKKKKKKKYWSDIIYVNDKILYIGKETGMLGTVSGMIHCTILFIVVTTWGIRGVRWESMMAFTFSILFGFFKEWEYIRHYVLIFEIFKLLILLILNSWENELQRYSLIIQVTHICRGETRSKCPAFHPPAYSGDPAAFWAGLKGSLVPLGLIPLPGTL